MQPTPFRLDLLGTPRLSSQSGAPPGRAAHKKRIALLAVLAVARRPVPRDRLVALLWPELASEPARHNLSEALYVLRKELGDGALVSGPGGDVALDAAVVSSDVAEFQDALDTGDGQAAAALYGGPLLDGFYVGDAPEYDRWVEAERDRLARAYGRAVEGLAEAAEAQGSLPCAVEWWRRLAAHDPFSSRTALRLVRALDAAGERPAALRVADAHAALLRHELGTAPGPELTAFAAALRAQPAPEPAPVSPRVPAHAPAESPPSVPHGDGAVEQDAAAPGAAPPAIAPVPAVPPASPPAPPAAPAGTVSPARPRGRGYRAAAAGVLLVVGLWWLALQAGARAPRAAPGHDPRRIAVLYFEDLSAGGDLRYLASGFTERLIHELSQVPALQVVSRGGVRPYRDGTVPFAGMVADLRVGSVVEGAVQRSGDSVWVTVRLVDANAGTRLESVEVGGAQGDLVRLQRALAHEVAQALRRRLGMEVRLRTIAAETESARALDLLMRAEQTRRDALDVLARDPAEAPHARRMLLAADSLLAAAEVADRRWGRPVLARGWLDLLRAEQAAGVPRRTLLRSAVRRAEVAAKRAPEVRAEALELRGRAHLRMAMELEATGQHAHLDTAERDLRAAVAAHPSLASGWSVLSQLLRLRGRSAESDLAARRALAEDAYLDEADDVRAGLFFSALWAADHAAARVECERGRRQFPADWRFVECGLTLLRNDLSRPPDPAAAWSLVARLERMDPPHAARAQARPYTPVFRRMVAAAVSARAGDGDSARAVLARAREELEGNPELELSLDYDEAWVRQMLGDAAGACRLVRRVAARRPWLAPYIAGDPLFCAPSARGGSGTGTAPPP